MSIQNIFSPKAARVVRVLLINPRKEWSILNLSEEAKTGYGHTYRLIKTMLKLGICRKTETNKVTVANPSDLLSRWAAQYDFNLHNKTEAYYSREQDIDTLLEKLSSGEAINSMYAATLHVGASLIAPYVRPASLHIYVKNEDERLVKNLNLQLTELGGNVFLVKPYDEGVFYGKQEIRGIYVVSNVQLYIDLYNYPARGREAAEHLRKVAIGY